MKLQRFIRINGRHLFISSVGQTLFGMMIKKILFYIPKPYPVTSVYAALWSEPLKPHALKNIGDIDIHIISVEIKKS